MNSWNNKEDSCGLVLWFLEGDENDDEFLVMIQKAWGVHPRIKDVIRILTFVIIIGCDKF